MPALRSQAGPFLQDPPLDFVGIRVVLRRQLVQLGRKEQQLLVALQEGAQQSGGRAELPASVAGCESPSPASSPAGSCAQTSARPARRAYRHGVCHGLELAHDLLEAGRQLSGGGRGADGLHSLRAVVKTALSPTLSPMRRWHPGCGLSRRQQTALHTLAARRGRWASLGRCRVGCHRSWRCMASGVIAALF